MKGDGEGGHLAPYFFNARLMVERCNGVRCSLMKNASPCGFMRARSVSHALIARSSSRRSGCVVAFVLNGFVGQRCASPLSATTRTTTRHRPKVHDGSLA